MIDSGFVQLGLEDTRNRAENDMGDGLPFVDLGTGLSVATVSGWNSLVGGGTCAAFSDGRVKCWGTQYNDDAGLGSQSDDMGDSLPFLDLSSVSGKAVEINGDMIMMDSGQVVKVLYNSGSRSFYVETADLGVNNTAHAVASGLRIQDGTNYVLVVLQDGSVKRFKTGSGGMGAFEAENNIVLGAGRKAVSCDTSSDHFCVVLDTSDVLCWGRNDNGELVSPSTV